MSKRCKLLIISLYIAIIIFTVLYLERIIAADESIFAQINSIYSPGWDLLFLMITYAGSTIFWIIATIFFWFKKQRKLATYMICAIIIDTILATILKQVFLRPRPYETFTNAKILDVESGLSFPSGHAERAFSASVIIGSFFKKARIPLFILAILVAFSRIYLGVHYPLDVIYGAFNGMIVGILCLSLPIKGFQKKLDLNWKKFRKRFKFIREIEDSI